MLQSSLLSNDIQAQSASGQGAVELFSESQLTGFIERVTQEGKRLYRDLPWRNTDDPYAILLSEVMLQQTQVARVLDRWGSWLNTFSTLDALAAASLADVLSHWQGMGYNRRALALKRTAEELSLTNRGEVPREYDKLLALPGIGPATAAGVCIFAFQQPQVYLETNVRTVFIHELFPSRESVHDRELIPWIKQTCPQKNPRLWYYALFDYGAFLKKKLPNPSRRSAHHSKQSSFEGSNRQKRAALLKLVLARSGVTSSELYEALNAAEVASGRSTVTAETTEALLKALQREGFVSYVDACWHIR